MKEKLIYLAVFIVSLYCVYFFLKKGPTVAPDLEQQPRATEQPNALKNSDPSDRKRQWLENQKKNKKEASKEKLRQSIQKAKIKEENP